MAQFKREETACFLGASLDPRGFQNPSGLSYSLEKREAVARLCSEKGVVLLEDDPYGELRFDGSTKNVDAG